MDMKILRTLLSILILFSNALILNCQSYLIYKDSDHYLCFNEDKDSVLWKHHSASLVIQYAIDHCKNEINSEVILGNGRFDIDKPIRLESNVWLHGKKRGTELNVNGSRGTGIVLEGAADVQISDLSIITANNFDSFAGIHAMNCKGLKISDVWVIGFANFGIMISEDFNRLIINRCTFINNEQAHIKLQKFEAESIDESVISNCTFFCGGYGVKAEKREDKGQGLEICDNIFAQLKGMAIDSDIDSAWISGNKLYWIGLDGMKLGGRGFRIEGNINSWIRGHGLVLDGARYGMVNGNNFTDLGVRSRNGFRKCGVAIYNSDYNIISGNSIWNFGDQGQLEYAVYENSNCINNILKGNAGWFYASPVAFRAIGENTIVENNTSNKGEYRQDDYWDYTQKYDYPVEKYLESLVPEKPAINGTNVHLSLEDQKSVYPEFSDEVIIESRDMFEQVVSVHKGSIRKFGWTGSESQTWEILKENDYFIIKNYETKELLQCEGLEENSHLMTGIQDQNIKDSQLWKLIDIGNGYYIIQNKLSGKVIESQGVSNYSWKENEVLYLGEPVTISEYMGRKTQMWKIKEPLQAYIYEN